MQRKNFIMWLENRDENMMKYMKELVGNQHKLDADHDGEITEKDFEILRRKKNKKTKK